MRTQVNRGLDSVTRLGHEQRGRRNATLRASVRISWAPPPTGDRILPAGRSRIWNILRIRDRLRAWSGHNAGTSTASAERITLGLPR